MILPFLLKGGHEFFTLVQKKNLSKVIKDNLTYSM